MARLAHLEPWLNIFTPSELTQKTESLIAMGTHVGALHSRVRNGAKSIFLPILCLQNQLYF
jgi:hypothetical protein